MKVALITGITGQDGAYLTEFLLEKGSDNFRRWLDHKEVVWMIDLPLFIRRSSLALTGLFNTGVVQVDTEFTYRITSLKGVSIAWSTAMLSVRLENSQSNFRVMNQGGTADASTQESNRMRFYYDKNIGNTFVDFVQHKSGWVEQLKKPLRPVKRALFSTLKRQQYEGNQSLSTGYVHGLVPLDEAQRLTVAFEVAEHFMSTYNAAHPTEFIFKNNQLTKALS